MSRRADKAGVYRVISVDLKDTDLLIIETENGSTFRIKDVISARAAFGKSTTVNQTVFTGPDKIDTLTVKTGDASEFRIKNVISFETVSQRGDAHEE